MQPVRVRETEVDERQTDRITEPVERLPTRLGVDDLETGLLQMGLERPADQRFVVDDQYGGGSQDTLSRGGTSGPRPRKVQGAYRDPRTFRTTPVA